MIGQCLLLMERTTVGLSHDIGLNQHVEPPQTFEPARVAPCCKAAPLWQHPKRVGRRLQAA